MLENKLFFKNMNNVDDDDVVEVLTKGRICLRKMRLSGPDYFEIKWGNFVAYLSSDKIYYTPLGINIKNT